MKITELTTEYIINELILLNEEDDDNYKQIKFMELLGDTYVNFIECVNNNYNFSTILNNYVIYCDSLIYPENINILCIKINELYPYYLKIIDKTNNNIIFNYFIDVD